MSPADELVRFVVGLSGSMVVTSAPAAGGPPAVTVRATVIVRGRAWDSRAVGRDADEASRVVLAALLEKQAAGWPEPEDMRLADDH
jgi:hypothetical protein